MYLNLNNLYKQIVCTNYLYLNTPSNTYKAQIPNIHALNSDTHTLFLSILILNSQCVGVAIEGMDIWYMAHIIWVLYAGKIVTRTFILNLILGFQQHN